MPSKTLLDSLEVNGGTHLQVLRRLEEMPPEAIQEFLVDVDPVSWVEQHTRTDHGTKLDMVNHPYLELVYNDWHPNQCYYKAAQVGLTQTTTGKLLYFAMKHKITAIYTMPTQQQVEKYSTARFNKIVSASPEILKNLTKNNASYKAIGDSSIYFSGTFNEQQAISIPSDINVHDELDFSKEDIRELYLERLAHSQWAFEWLFSTPTIPGFGIHSFWKQSDQRHWFVRCSGCGRWQRIRWDNHAKHNVREVRKYGRHVRWYYGCTKCDKELDRRNGMWVVKRESKSQDLHGYHIPQTIVPVMSAATLKKKERVAKKKGRYKVFVNFNLGEAYSTGQMMITKELMRTRTFPFENPYRTTKWFLGVDQGDLKHWVLSRMVQNVRVNVRWGVYDDWKDIVRLIREYNVVSGIIDALPNKDNAKEVRDLFPGKIFLCYYKSNQAAEMKLASDNEEFAASKKREEYAFSVDHTESLDKTAREWVEGTAWLYGTPDSLDNPRSPESAFVGQMVNLKRDEEEDKHGNMRGVWKKTGADHYRHADNYARMALDFYGRNNEAEFRSSSVNGASTDIEGESANWTETESGLLVPDKEEYEWRNPS